MTLLSPVTLSRSRLPCIITWAPAHSPVALLVPSPVPRWRGHEDADGLHTTCQIPHQDNIHSPAVRPHFWALIIDPDLLSPSGPSTPPEELQLSALDSSSVLVSWRPPLEPNGIIISYRILYSGNLSQPEHLWENLSQDGGWPVGWHDLLICNESSNLWLPLLFSLTAKYRLNLLSSSSEIEWLKIGLDAVPVPLSFSQGALPVWRCRACSVAPVTFLKWVQLPRWGRGLIHR